MKPLEAFLVSLHPEVVERGTTLLQGQEVEYGKACTKELRRLVHEHHAAGQETLAKFYKWLVRSEALRPVKAENIVATVWNTLCMTYDAGSGQSNPLVLLDLHDETYSYSTKIAISHALRLWARYTKDTTLQGQLLLWAKRRPDVTPRYVLDELNTSPPYTRAEYRRLLKALEEYKGAPRYPWAWAVLRICFTQGVTVSEIIRLERTKIQQALQQGEVLLRIGWMRSKQAIPVELVREELEYLLSFPWEWGVIGDLVDPVKSVSAKKDYGRAHVHRLIRDVFTRAKVTYSSGWATRLRWSAAWQYHNKTGNLVGAAQILRMNDMSKVANFFAELRKRDEVRKAKQDEEDVSSTN